MVKDFRVVLAPPPQNGYVELEVTGHVVLVTDEATNTSWLQNYRSHPQRIWKVVRWSENRGSGENQHTVTYHSLVSVPRPIKEKNEENSADWVWCMGWGPPGT